MRYQKLDRWFGRCKTTGCKLRRVVESPHIAGGRTIFYDYTPAHMDGLIAAGLWCHEHNRGLEFNQLKGRYAENRECNGVCMGAVGPSCDCQCGGENHGKSHC